MFYLLVLKQGNILASLIIGGFIQIEREDIFFIERLTRKVIKTMPPTGSNTNAIKVPNKSKLACYKRIIF